MKKILTVICLLVLFASCDNTPTEVKDPQKETTVQLQQLAAIDTVDYKVVELNDVMYVIKDDLVVKKVKNQSGDSKSAPVGLLIGFVVGFLICLVVIHD